MTDLYANWAALAAAEVYGTDYHLEVRRTPSRVSHIAVHGGGIEVGSSELANAVASLTGQQYYAMVATKSANNSDLHITSTHFDEPQALDVQASSTRTVSYHGLSGTSPETHMGGGDSDLLQRIGNALEAEGFTVVWGTSEDVNGDDPANITNRNRSGAGVQLEMTRALRDSFFPNGDTSRTMRESGERTEDFWRYAMAIASVTQPLEVDPPTGDGGLYWGPEAAAMVPGEYRLLVCDLLTDRLIDVLPVTGLSFDDYIGKSGSLSGTVPVADADMAARAKAALVNGRTALWVLRNGEVWWSGVLWTNTPTVDGRGNTSVDISGATAETYFEHRRLWDDYRLASVDPLAGLRYLIDYAQGFGNGSIGVDTTSTLSGPTGGWGTVIRVAYGAEDVLTIREAVDKMAEDTPGFEWRIRCFVDNEGVRRRALQAGSPKLRVGDNAFVMSYPGNVLSYSLPDDGTDLANVLRARGGTLLTDVTADAKPVMSDVTVYGADLTGGWPRLDGVNDYPDFTDKFHLDNVAAADVVSARTPKAIPTVTVRLDDTVPSALLGTTARLRVTDLFNPNGLDQKFRVVGVKVTPTSRGAGESAELYLEAS